jgi:predicted DCC family thiol-disulfide oxidoreductase YuxK
VTKFDDKPILFYDGFCNLCSGFVQFVMKRNAGGNITFAPLQSPESKEFLARHDVDATRLDTMVCVVDGRAYTRSTGVIRIVQNLPGGWCAVRVLLILPASIRDWAYDFVGRNRYRWFGQRSTCYLPPPAGDSVSGERTRGGASLPSADK